MNEINVKQNLNSEIKYCKKCVMPNTRPGIVFDNQDVCSACRNYEKRETIDWKKRWDELKQLCDKYRSKDGSHDCMIAVSSGKDSHYQIYVMKELMGMNPLLVSADTLFSWTETGRKNFKNLGESFGCDVITLTLNSKINRKMVRVGFEEWGRAAYPMDLAIYVYPIRMAINFNIPLLVYGENVSYEYGGYQTKETYSCKEQIMNDVTKPIDFDFWAKRGVHRKDLNQFIYPSVEEINESKIDPIYLSYFAPWNSYQHYLIAKQWGFRDLGNEWKRAGHLDDFTQIDTVGYLMDAWLKYPKFGHQQVTDIASRMVRYGYMTRAEAVEAANKEDYKLDDKILDDFLAFTGYSNREFWEILEKFWNRDIFEKVNGEWKLKNKLK